ncbi:unnamed protein product [Somion occarium]|uniref:Uncharacterized protein n=1 Tax=Somion occarium TaxID=3059160 RepID=A0ABP1CJV5_9APHY
MKVILASTGVFSIFLRDAGAVIAPPVVAPPVVAPPVVAPPVEVDAPPVVAPPVVVAAPPVVAPPVVVVAPPVVAPAVVGPPVVASASLAEAGLAGASSSIFCASSSTCKWHVPDILGWDVGHDACQSATRPKYKVYIPRIMQSDWQAPLSHGSREIWATLIRETLNVKQRSCSE